MSQLEDEIRDSLRSEAQRLRAVRPLRLPPAAARPGPRGAFRGARPRWQRPWQPPVMAAAVIVLVAAALVTAKVLRNGSVVPAPSSGPAAAAAPANSADVTPRYYVRFGWATEPGENPSQGNNAIIVGDVQTGKTLGSYNLPKGDTLVWEASGAADDRTFAVSASVFQSAQHPVIGPARFYLVRLLPGSADPVRVTPLSIQATPPTSVATQVTSIALSGDGSELAVVFNTGKSVGLAVYSVATGRLQHSWSAAISGVGRVATPVTDPSWVGDGTVGFAFIDTPDVRQDVRTLDVGSAGTSLLADSHVVWTQYVPPPAGGKYGKATPQACGTPFLTGDGRAVACAATSYSASTNRLSALWLAYPLSLGYPLDPATRPPRVIGSVTEPQDVKGFNGPNAVLWTNSSGTEVIGNWNPEVTVSSKNFQGPATSVTNHYAFIGGGQVRPFTWNPGPRGAAW